MAGWAPSRSPPALFTSENSGRAAGMPVKSARKMALVGKARRQGDVREREVGLGNQCLCSPNATSLDKAYCSRASAALEQSSEMKTTHIHNRREFGEAYWTIKIILDISNQLPKLFCAERWLMPQLVGLERVVPSEHMRGKGCRDRIDDEDLRWVWLQVHLIEKR
jgi:hypothetical protein